VVRLRHFFVALSILAISAGGAHAAVVEKDWRDVSVDRQQIDMLVPGIGDWSPGFWRSVKDTPSEAAVADFTQWNEPDRPGYYAFLTYQRRLAHRFMYIRLKDMIAVWRGSYEITEFSSDELEYKGYKFIYYKILSQEFRKSCVSFGKITKNRKKIVYGHYCEPGKGNISDLTVHAIIDSISLPKSP